MRGFSTKCSWPKYSCKWGTCSKRFRPPLTVGGANVVPELIPTTPCVPILTAGTDMLIHNGRNDSSSQHAGNSAFIAVRVFTDFHGRAT